jgi:hypothetical protein
MKLLCYLLLIHTIASAIPLYRMYTGDCAYKEGAIVDINEGRISLLELSGQISEISSEDVRLIAVYESLENPFHKVNDVTLYRLEAKSVHGSIQAVVVGFAEDVILFLDTKSHSIAIGFDEFSSIASLKQESLSFSNTVSVSLSPPELAITCPIDSRKASRTLSAQSVLAGEFVIRAFVEHQEAGFSRLEGLVERSLFYPRPMMYDTKSRLGLFYLKNNYYNKIGYKKAIGAPLFFSSGSGDPYRFQGEYGMGFIQADHSPSVYPEAYVFSRFKSHILHGELILNLNGAAAGSSTNRNTLIASSKSSTYLMSDFNHMTLLGLDFDSYGVSFGSVIKTYCIESNLELREASFGKPSPIFVLSYTTPKSKVEAVMMVDQTRAELSRKHEAPSQDTIGLKGAFRHYTTGLEPEKMKVDSKVLRFNMKQQVFSFHLKLSVIHEMTKLSEQANILIGESATERSGAQVTNSFEAKQTTLYAGYQQDLGEWVGLRAEVMLHSGDFTASFGDSRTKASSHRVEAFSYLAGFDLLL